MGKAVGIDLGTTFSAIAIVDQDHEAQAILNAEGKLITPSVALWHENAYVVGQAALDLIEHAEGDERTRLAAALIRGVKRMVGNPPKGGLISNGHRTTPIEVSAAILAKLARDASARLDFPVRDAVITVPAHFGDRERSATKEAAEMAGLHVLQIINEPSAAALTYTHGEETKPGIALVFDLGGGTFDATILQIGEGVSRVLSTKGIEELGGINFTNKLAGDLRKRYETETKVPYPQDSLSIDCLIVAAEAAKCALSDGQTTIVHLAPPQSPAVDLAVTRKQFNNSISLFLLQLQTAVEVGIERAGKTPADIARVLLCGGSSRIPAIQNMLTEFFGHRPETILDLDLSVALGAAYQAAYSEEPALQLEDGGLVIDCVSYPVGIAVKNAIGEPIKLVMLRPGDPLNIWSQPFAVRILGAANAFPPLAVYKGEGSQLYPKDKLGEIVLALPPGTPQGARATIAMSQDLNGLIQVQINVEGQNLPGVLQRDQVQVGS
jgi:molecular chaperone DnaK